MGLLLDELFNLGELVNLFSAKCLSCSILCGHTFAHINISMLGCFEVSVAIIMLIKKFKII